MEKEAVSGLKDATDPLAWIQANIRAAEPTVAPAPETAQFVPPPPPPMPDISFGQDATTSQTSQIADAPPVAAAESEYLAGVDPALPGDELGEIDSEESGPKVSIRKLRQKMNQYKATVEEREAALKTAQDELVAYKTGEAQPEVIKKLQERVNGLQYYERLHALRLSPEYQEKYVSPLTELGGTATSLANNYGVDPQVLNQAKGIENRRERNQFLRNYFDDIGVVEVGQILDKYRDIEKQAVDAEKEPAGELEKLRSQYENQQRTTEQRRINTIIANSRDGWLDGLTEIQDSGEYPELVIKANDERHNAVSRPIVEEAAREYARYVKWLGTQGIKDMPRSVAKDLAKRFLWSQASPVMAVSRAAHYREREAVIKENRLEAPMLRPPIGSGVSSAPITAPTAPKNPTEAAEFLLRKVGVTR